MTTTRLITQSALALSLFSTTHPSALKRRWILLLLVTLASLNASISHAEQDWVYTVRKADTLWDLCLEYTTKKNCWLEIGTYNEVDYPRSLAPGTRIRFPVSWLKAQPVKVELIYVSGEVLVAEQVIQNKRNSSRTNSSHQSTRLNNDNARPAQLGEQLSIGTRIQTADNSSASLRFADGAIMVLEPNTQVLFDTLSQHGSTGMVDTRVNLITGSTNTRVPRHKQKSQFRVSTPSAVAAVRGTNFRISTDGLAAATTFGEVFEGEVNVNQPTTDSDVSLEQGFGIKVNKDTPLMEAQKLLPAPEWNNTESIATLPSVLRWEALENAAQYSLQVLENTDQEKLISSSDIQTNEFPLSLAHSGCHKFKLSAYDNIGLRGMPAERTLCAAAQPEAPVIAVINNRERQALSWTAIPGAKTYQIDISKDIEFVGITQQLTLTENTFDLSILPNKKRYVRVTAIGDYEIVSKPSNIVEHSPSRRGLLALGIAAIVAILAL